MVSSRPRVFHTANRTVIEVPRVPEWSRYRVLEVLSEDISRGGRELNAQEFDFRMSRTANSSLRGMEGGGLVETMGFEEYARRLREVMVAIRTVLRRSDSDSCEEFLRDALTRLKEVGFVKWYDGRYEAVSSGPRDTIMISRINATTYPDCDADYMAETLDIVITDTCMPSEFNTSQPYHSLSIGHYNYKGLVNALTDVEAPGDSCLSDEVERGNGLNTWSACLAELAQLKNYSLIDVGSEGATMARLTERGRKTLEEVRPQIAALEEALCVSEKLLAQARASFGDRINSVGFGRAVWGALANVFDGDPDDSQERILEWEVRTLRARLKDACDSLSVPSSMADYLSG